MKLSAYNKKRNFQKTSEPLGKIKNTKTAKMQKSRFVVQYHRATTNHFDFRLAYEGVLISFAVPKGLPNKKEKRLAVHVEDHPIEYIGFEGTIPKGEYGAGTVEIFDEGFYLPQNDFKYGLKNGKLKFELFGKKFSGIYSLVKMDEKNWLMMKNSSKNDAQETSEKQKITEKKFKNPFKSVDCKLCLLTDKIPNSKDYIYEIKYDGYRIVAFCENGKVVLKSRNNKDFSNKFANVKKSLEKLKTTVVIDGEIVVFDEKGRSDFGLLQNSIESGYDNFVYVVFDILALNGKDLRKFPLKERKIFLENNINFDDTIVFCDYVKDNGKKVFAFAKKNNLEGIVAKNVLSTYNGKRDKDWLKIKCYHEQEFVIVGFKTTEKNKKLSAIFVGYYDSKDI
ncbi:MAG: DNA polymerase ligase N-terminal domain-containing protein [Christensenellales bacterium]